MAETLEQLAHAESQRALSQQEGVLNELRARTGTLLTASSLVASFLGGRAIDLEGFGALNVTAALAFLITIVISVYLLAQKSQLEFALRGSEVYEFFVREGTDIPEAHQTLAYWIDEAHARNKKTIDRLVIGFGVACVALIPEVAGWSLSLAVH